MHKIFYKDRMLIIRGGGLGDFIQTLPAVYILKNQAQPSKLDLLGTRRFGILGENRYYFDKVYDIGEASFTPLFSQDLIPRLALRDYFESVDIVLCYTPDEQGILRKNLYALGVKKVIYCPPFRGVGNVVEWLAKPIMELGIINSLDCLPPPMIFLSKDDERKALALLFGIEKENVKIAIHPGSGSQKKCWPVENWISFCQRIQKMGCRLLLIMGPAEMERKELSEIPADVRIINQDLPSVGAILKLCNLFCGHDSGITQLAMAVGCPSIALFGPTDPTIWMYPRLDKRFKILWNKDSRLTISVDEVFNCFLKCLKEGI
ncbi:lipopolysaccharide heptosyltransferase family protein [Methylacidiphilum fumariolicum]|nr:lipopolysaccharide heptosyltransferase family protein [Candidatus Methylacidiphilum fumarolicum]